jgi:hypothetical protein
MEAISEKLKKIIFGNEETRVTALDMEIIANNLKLTIFPKKIPKENLIVYERIECYIANKRALLSKNSDGGFYICDSDSDFEVTIVDEQVKISSSSFDVKYNEEYEENESKLKEQVLTVYNKANGGIICFYNKKPNVHSKKLPDDVAKVEPPCSLTVALEKHFEMVNKRIQKDKPNQL